MTTQNNPLKQFFRRPSVHIKLPSGGKMYDAGVMEIPESGELPVYPMTAIDDITVKTPDALFNGAAVTEVIKSCIPAIKNPWMINSMDLDAILVGIRIATNGDVLEVESICPKCNDVATQGVALSVLLTTITPGDYNTPLVIGDLTFKFKPLTYTEMNKAAIKTVYHVCFDIRQRIIGHYGTSRWQEIEAHILKLIFIPAGFKTELPYKRERSLFT